MWVEDHKFLAVWRGVWIMPPFQGLSVNQIGTSINLSWEHLAQKELWCTSDVVHGVGRVLAEVHSTAVISYPGNGNIKLEQWQPGITLDGWASALAHSRRMGKDKETKVTTARADLRTDLANDREKNWASEVAFSPLRTPSRSYIFDVALSLLNLPVLFRDHQGVTTSDTPKRHTHWCLWNNKSIGEGWTTIPKTA